MPGGDTGGHKMDGGEDLKGTDLDGFRHQAVDRLRFVYFSLFLVFFF